MKEAKYSLSIAINRLAQLYSVLILAIGLNDQHHSMSGRYVDTHIDLKILYCTSVNFYTQVLLHHPTRNLQER